MAAALKRTGTKYHTRKEGPTGIKEKKGPEPPGLGDGGGGRAGRFNWVACDVFIAYHRLMKRMQKECKARLGGKAHSHSACQNRPRSAQL